MDTKKVMAGNPDNDGWLTETEIVDGIRTAYCENRSPQDIFLRKRLSRMAEEVKRLRERYGDRK